FRWDAGSTAADDGVFVLHPSSAPGSGRWVRVLEGDAYNAAWWGPDRTGVASCDLAVQAADAAAATAGVSLRFPAGAYRFSVSYASPSPLELAAGALLRPLFGVTLTLADTPAVPFGRQVFDLSGTGTVKIAAPTGPVSPSWWGAKGDAVTVSAN